MEKIMELYAEILADAKQLEKDAKELREDAFKFIGINQE